MATCRTLPPGSAADPALAHLILVGLPGSGKSTVGAELARELGRSFLDFDTEISRREGMTIAELFGQRGEPAFRELEHALTRELRDCGDMVLAPGGGWVTRPENVALLCPPSRLIYLKLRPAAALLRMGSEAASRPLLRRPDPLGELERLHAARRSAYESADLVIDVEGIGVEEVTRRIVERL
jgi:shikimate kinase